MATFVFSSSLANFKSSSHLAVPTHGLELSRLATSAWRPWQHHPGQSVIEHGELNRMNDHASTTDHHSIFCNILYKVLKRI
jgi:hypothetical protein